MYHNTKEHLLKDKYWLNLLKHTIFWLWFILALHPYFLVIPKVKHTKMVFCCKMVFFCKKKDIWTQHFCFRNSVFQIFICEDSPIFIHMKELAIPYQYNRIVKCRTNWIQIITSFWELELLLFFNEKPAVSRGADLLLFGHLLLADSMFCCVFKRIAYRNILNPSPLFWTGRWPPCFSPWEGGRVASGVLVADDKVIKIPRYNQFISALTLFLYSM